MRCSRLAVLLAALSTLAGAGCQGPPTAPAKGPCAPTVEGAGGGGYKDYNTAHQAFTRAAHDNSLTATLEDVSWLRYEGDEDTIVKKHRPYFEQGYTTFDLALFTKDFVQPTTETWILEDSAGARVTSRPISYEGSMGQENERFAARFNVSFRHAITKDVDWVRLTRASDGTHLEWVFHEEEPAAPAGGRTCAVPPTTCADGASPRGKRMPQAQPLLHPRNPAPDAGAGAGNAMPVNLLTHPEAAHFPASAPPDVAVEPQGVQAVPPASLPPAPVVEAPSMPPPAPPALAPPLVEPAPLPSTPPPPPGALPPPKSRRVPAGS